MTAVLTRWLWAGFLVLGGVATAVMMTTPSITVYDLIYVGLSAGVVVAIVLGVRLHQPASPWPWLCMAAGQLLWVMADAFYFWLVDVLGDDVYPSVADALYLMGYAVLAFSLLLLIREGLAERDESADVGVILDSATVTAGLGLVAWVVLAQPTLQAASEDSVMAAVVSAAYPMVDILLIGVVVQLVVSSIRPTPTLRLLLLALFLLVSADIQGAVYPLSENPQDPPLDVFWVGSYVVWGAAVLHPSMAFSTADAPADSPGDSTSATTDAGSEVAVKGRLLTTQRVAAMTLATLVAPTILAVQHLLGVPISVWPIVVGSCLMFLLVLARLNLAVAQIDRAAHQQAVLQNELVYQAAHDPLTALPNRSETLDLIRVSLDQARENTGNVAVLILDLDHFKTVNDVFGPRVGDDILRTIAGRLVGVVRDGDVATRFGGDEFAVVLADVEGEDAAVAVAERVLASIAKPVSISGGQGVQVEPRLGLSIALGGDGEADTLVREAGLALTRAKASSLRRPVVFGAELRDQLTARAELEAALVTAMANDELRLHYQPIHELSTGTVRGFEALVRWQRPGVGLVPPDEFLPVAEASDLICDLGVWVLNEATRQLAYWSAQQHNPRLTVSVNLSGRHVGKERVIDDVAAALGQSGLPARQLVVEFTETVLVAPDIATRHLSGLRNLGVAISLDDFGTGYSSVGLIGRLPLDEVKIAGEYLDPSSPSSLLLLELMVKAAHSAGLPVVGEGVETPEQLAVLQSLGCDFAQGYYLGRPMRREELDLPGDLVDIEWTST